MIRLIDSYGGSDKERKKIKRIEFASNYLDNIEYFERYENITDLNINYNDFTTFGVVKNFKKL